MADYRYTVGSQNDSKVFLGIGQIDEWAEQELRHGGLSFAWKVYISACTLEKERDFEFVCRKMKSKISEFTGRRKMGTSSKKLFTINDQPMAAICGYVEIS